MSSFRRHSSVGVCRRRAVPLYYCADAQHRIYLSRSGPAHLLREQIRLKRLFIPAIIAVAMLSLSACASAQATQTAPAANVNLAVGTATNVPTQKPTQEAIAAVVNDQTIT